MKKIKNIIVLTGLMIAILLPISSCDTENYLETIDKSNLNDATIWTSDQNADLYLLECYRDLAQKSSESDNLDNFTDDNDAAFYYTSWNWRGGTVHANTNNYSIWFGQSGPAWDANWPGTYVKIRRLNTFIQKVNENAESLSAEWVAQRIDEARFLRAFQYSELFYRIGGLSIIEVPQDRTIMEEDELLIPRSTFEETYNYIVNELTDIINNENLPVKYTSGEADAGRATLGAALALKGWIQLFAASPAYNSEDPAIPRSSDNLQSFAEADHSRYTAAAETNKKFIETFGHKGSGEYDLFSDMTKFWYEANEYNKEVIFDRQQVAVTMPNLFHRYGGVVWLLDGYMCWGNYCPTQEIVDQYMMENGLPIEDPNSGYDPQNPYVGREKRFYNFIVYDGAPYKQDWMPKTDTVYTRIDLVNPSKNEIDFGGDDVSNTGYYLKKRIPPNSIPGSNTSGQNYVYYRYAEVLLNYAEAQNEAVGPDASVYDAINYLRARPSTNLPPLEEGLSQDEMREIIRRERRVELHYEGKRLFDIWRWKIMMDVMNKPLHSMVIRNSVPENNSGKWIYTPTALESHPHSVSQKQYFNPIPQEAIDRNPKLIQNWGY
ncbi:RagB/SusD family nutrient uptake outer membrane protein [Draconibacterium sediminis]|uniref:RagB/SusD family nutrient uptake outer membrane protein n=1 Tax=Draconibacterium sediminis TaxID=1544798 RepID=UPI0026E944B2|nr:RagB/SusD family nutrient uptake outer membrane protein [Draconibacterium sediminis]